MKGLLIKEFCVLKRTFVPFLICSFVFAVICHSVADAQMRLFSLSVLGIMAAAISLGSANRDMQYGGGVYFASLPYSKAQIVGSKYVLGLLGTVFAIIINGISAILRFYVVDTPFVMGEVYFPLAVLAMSMMSCGIGVAVSYRFGHNAGGITGMGLLSFAVAFHIARTAISTKNGLSFSSMKFETFFVIVVVSVVVYAVSWLCALHSYKKYGTR